MHNRVSIITTGASSSPGVVASVPTGGTGQWVTVQIADDGDGRNAQNSQACAIGTSANLDFIAWRTVDWVDGFDGSVWSASVSLGNRLSLGQELTVNAASGQSAGHFVGWTGSIAMIVGATNADGLVVTVVSGNGRAVVGEGSGTGAGVEGIGGAGDGHGVVGTAGGAGGSGIKAVAFSPGQTSLWAAKGPINVDTEIGSVTDDPGANLMWATQIPKAWAFVTLDGSGGITVDANGLNIASAAFGDAIGTDRFSIVLTFARDMSIGNYVVNVTPAPGFSGTPTVPHYDNMTLASFAVKFVDLTNIPSLLSLFNTGTGTGPTGSFAVMVMGRQS